MIQNEALVVLVLVLVVAQFKRLLKQAISANRFIKVDGLVQVVEQRANMRFNF